MVLANEMMDLCPGRTAEVVVSPTLPFQHYTNDDHIEFCNADGWKACVSAYGLFNRMVINLTLHLI